MYFGKNRSLAGCVVLGKAEGSTLWKHFWRYSEISYLGMKKADGTVVQMYITELHSRVDKSLHFLIFSPPTDNTVVKKLQKIRSMF